MQVSPAPFVCFVAFCCGEENWASVAAVPGAFVVKPSCLLLAELDSLPLELQRWAWLRGGRGAVVGAVPAGGGGVAAQSGIIAPEPFAVGAGHRPGKATFRAARPLLPGDRSR